MLILNYFNKQISEIQSSKVQRIYALLLVLPHIFTFFYWQDLFPFVFSNKTAAICWPFFNNCQSTHIFSKVTAVAMLWGYFLAAIFCAFQFLKLERVPRGFYFLLFLNCFKYFVVIQDYRFMGNYHYMPLLLSFAFLLLPFKISVSKLLIILFYFSASLLKFNYEWISGMAIGESFPGLPLGLFRMGCAYVVVLESVLIFGLLSPSKWLRWITLLQLSCFHLISWYWVGFFYPLNMFALLAIFPLTWFLMNEENGEGLFWQKKPMSVIIFFSLYLACQIVPRFLPGDLALDGRLRMTMLNMFDARSVCLKTILLHYKKAHVEWVGDTDLSVRIHCDPIVVLSDARLLCEEQKMNPEFLDADVVLVTRRLTDRKAQTLLNQENFCSKVGLMNGIQESKRAMDIGSK